MAWGTFTQDELIQAAINRRNEMMAEWPRKVKAIHQPSIKYERGGFVAGRSANWRVDYWVNGVHKCKRFNLADYADAERQAREFAEGHKHA